MPRYDEMDEIIGRLRKRVDNSPDDTPSRPEPEVRGARRKPLIGIANPAYEQAVELMTRILRDTERAQEMLAEMPEESLTAREHETLVGLTGRARKELWRCENALGRLAPYE
jgi:hypothetical protein